MLILAAATLSGCSLGGGGNNVANHSPASSASASASASEMPTTSPSAPPPPVTDSFGVLVSSQAASSYTVSIVTNDGTVVASAQSSAPTLVNCASAAAALVSLPVSTTNSGVYFLDALGTVRSMRPTGATRNVTTVPVGTASRRSMFAVSPDDQRIAVVVADFTSSGASTRLYVEDLNGGGNHVDIFTESGSYTLWPIGWHGTNNLVVAKVPSCTQGGGPFCCGPLELHVVDPATANRRFTLGSSSSCVIAGPPSPSGVVCENTATYTQATVLNWTSGTIRTLPLNGPTFAYLSPDGASVAKVDNSGTSFTNGAGSIAGMFACGWIDNDHVFSGGDALHQPRVAAVTEGKLEPVAAQGDCGGRIPGGL